MGLQEREPRRFRASMQNRVENPIGPSLARELPPSAPVWESLRGRYGSLDLKVFGFDLEKSQDVSGMETQGRIHTLAGWSNGPHPLCKIRIMKLVEIPEKLA